MLKISQPYIRETPVRDEKEGRNVVMKIEPPGLTIGFRLRGGRTTWHLPVVDAYMAARYSQPQYHTQKRVSYERAKPTSLKDQILAVLKDKGKLNIAQVMQQMREKGQSMRRNEAGTILELMKAANLVKQDGFNYELNQNGDSARTIETKKRQELVTSSSSAKSSEAKKGGK